MRAAAQFLPETGRGTIRRMVEGHAPETAATCPSTTFGGPPPPVEEEP